MADFSLIHGKGQWNWANLGCLHRVIRKEAGHDLPQPFALFWD